MSRITVALLALGLVIPAAHAQAPAPPAGLPNVTDETRTAARELLNASGAEATATQMLTLLRGQMIAIFQRAPGKTAEETAKAVDELLLPELKARIGELLAMLAEIYASNYTVDEMNQLVAFYRSPLGQRVVAAAPKIGQESVVAGQAWGQRVGRDAIEKHAADLRRRGITL